MQMWLNGLSKIGHRSCVEAINSNRDKHVAITVNALFLSEVQVASPIKFICRSEAAAKLCNQASRLPVSR